MHLARGMRRRNVERGEIIVVGLDLRAFGDGETHIAEDLHDLVVDLGQRMDPPARLAARGKREVEALFHQAARQLDFAERGFARGNRGGHAVLEAVDRGAPRFALLRAHCAEGFEELGDAALLAEGADAHLFERGFVARGLDCAEEALFEVCESVRHRL